MNIDGKKGLYMSRFEREDGGAFALLHNAESSQGKVYV
jgi:hypothetical protein